MTYKFEYPIADAINDIKLDEFEGYYEDETFCITDDKNEWIQTTYNFHHEYTMASAAVNMPEDRLPNTAAADYIIHNFNVVKYQLGPVAIDKGKTLSAKSVKLTNIEDFSKHVSPDDKIYLYYVYQAINRYVFDEELNQLELDGDDARWIIRYSVFPDDE